MGWPVTSGNVFLFAAVAGLALAPIAGAARGRHTASRSLPAVVALVFLASMALLMISWRAIPGGVVAAAAGHAALLISMLTLASLGRLARGVFSNTLAAGLAGLVAAIVITVGPFALGPLLQDAPLSLCRVIFFANPLVNIASAADIDLLHVDVIYRLSPLAHRGVALPAWITACSAYAVLGLAGFGASHLRLRSA